MGETGLNTEGASAPSFYSVPPIWHDQTVFILGGGPSLKHCDLELLRGKNVLGINNAFRFGDILSCLFFMDRSFWVQHGDEVKRTYDGLIISDSPHDLVSRDARVNVMKRLNGNGFQWQDKSALYHGRNSGHCAIQLAILAGARRICLLGYDMKREGTVANWHPYYGVSRDDLYEKFMQSFVPLARDIETMRQETGRIVNILNLNPDSALEIFPKIRVEWNRDSVDRLSEWR